MLDAAAHQLPAADLLNRTKIECYPLVRVRAVARAPFCRVQIIEDIFWTFSGCGGSA